MSIATGTVLADRWELTSRLAVGGMGDVFRAQDHELGDEVAVKVLRSGIMQGEQRFASEIATLQRLDHPHVVSVIDAGEQDGLPYLVMELLPGRTLSDLLRDGALPLDRVHHIGTAIAAALDYTHGRGVINRDIKPSNILFTAQGTAKLADFGIAKLVDASGITGTGQALGTASYIAPEQLSAPDRVGPATDVYSLGLVLLEAATGARAFPGTGTEAAMARLARDPEVPATLSDGWQRLLRTMTARDPAGRPTAAQVVEVLEADLSAATLDNLPPVPPPSSPDDATVPMSMVGGLGAVGAPGAGPAGAGAAGAGAGAGPVAADPGAAADAPTRALAHRGADGDAAADEATRVMPAGRGGAASAGAAAGTADRSRLASRAWWVALLLALVAAATVWAFAAERGPFADDPAETPSEAPAEPEAPQEPEQEPGGSVDDDPDGQPDPSEDQDPDAEPDPGGDEPAPGGDEPAPDPGADDGDPPPPEDGEGGVDLPGVDEDQLDLDGPAQGSGEGLLNAPGQNEG